MIKRYDDKIRLMQDGILYHCRLYYDVDDKSFTMIMSKPKSRLSIRIKTFDINKLLDVKNVQAGMFSNSKAYPIPNAKNLISRYRVLIEKCRMENKL